MPTEKEQFLLEDMDKRKMDEMLKVLGERNYTRPEDLKNRTDIKIAIYRENTYISIYEESRKTGISMHKICAQRGLDFKSLLI